MKTEAMEFGGRGAGAAQPPRRLSTVLRELAAKASGPVTFEQIRAALGDRSFAALLFFFSALNLLPLPPGSTLILGIPLVLLSAQMVAGHKTAWLPRYFLDRSLSAEQFGRLSGKAIPWLTRLERVVKPRYWPFARDHADRAIGLIALVLAIAVTLPIPLGNWLPAFACALIALALSERDGVLLSIALAIGLVSLLIIGVVVGAAGAVAGMLIASF